MRKTDERERIKAIEPRCKLHALIFDLDGTLIDSHRDIASACNHALAEVDAPPRSDAEIKTMIGGGVRRLLARALATDDAEKIESARRHFAPAYRACLVDQTEIYPGLDRALSKLLTLGIPMCIATNKPRAFTAPIFESLNLKRWFLSWASGDEVPARKPNPEVLSLALSRAQLSTDTQACVYIGDMDVDVETAHNAGCIAIRVTWGFGKTQPMPPADHLVTRPEELVEAIKMVAALLNT